MKREGDLSTQTRSGEDHMKTVKVELMHLQAEGDRKPLKLDEEGKDYSLPQSAGA